MQAALRSTLRSLGHAVGRRPFVSAEEEAYRRLVQKGYRPRGIIDVGAYHGDWTRLARRVFGAVPTLMIEAQPGKAEALQRMCQEPDLQFASAVLGASAGKQVTFYEMETGSSMLPERSNVDRVERKLVTRTLDEVAQAIPGPVFLKIDVQGAEIEVLEGGEATLGRADLVQLEVALLPYNEGAPTFLDVVGYMDAKGFVPYDISGLTRPTGVDLVQVDIIFAPRGSPLRPERFSF